MGLMQLLTVGRSLSEARDRPHRFKVLSSAMPTFGHPTDVERTQNGERPVAEPVKETAEHKTDLGEQTMKTETAQAGEKVEKESGMNAYPLGRWTLKANPFKSSIKPSRPPGVQGELSLEKVKVVRNDLSDSDLELVAASSEAKAVEPPGNVFAAPDAAETMKVSIWARIKGRWSRLFRAKAQ